MGVDRCRGGWVCAWRESGTWRLLRFPSFRAALEAFPDPAVLAVDMPIDLHSEGWRACDLEARRLLGPHGGRVFLAPPRPCLAAKTPLKFQETHRRLTGKGSGVPVWRIVPQIREVDEALKPAHHRRVFEAHPELAFLALAGGPLPSKHTAEGLAQRRRLLGVERLEDGRLLSDDDLDAMALHLVASAWAQGRARTLPEAPPLDETGKPMRIVAPIAL